MVNQFDIWEQNRGRTTSVAKEKTKKKPVNSALSKYIPALARGGKPGPDGLALQQDAWGNAMGQMQSVNATTPLVAGAQALGMGMAGYGMRKARDESEAGSAEYRKRLADALSGNADNATLMGLAFDPWADQAGSAAALKMWERNNPTEDQLLQRKAAQQQYDAGAFELSQAQEEADRAEQLRLGRQSAVEKYYNDPDYKAQGGDLFSPDMQMFNRQNGISGVDPRDSVMHDQLKPYIDARDYDKAFETMVSPDDKGDFIEVDGALYNTKTGEWTQSPTGGETDDITEYQKAVEQGFEGSFMDYQVQMKKAGATSNNFVQTGENAYAKKRAEGFADFATEADKGEASATRMLMTLDSMTNAMNSPDFYSGAGAEQVMAFKQAIVAMGGDPSSVKDMESFGAQAKQLALDAMGGSLGTGFSNADRDFVLGQVPGLGYTAQGNAALIEINRRMAKRKIEVARRARAYEAEHGQLDAKFMQELSVWAEANPVFGGISAPRVPQRPPADLSDGDLQNLLNQPIGGN